MGEELTKQAYKEVEGMIEKNLIKFEQNMKDEFIELKEYMSTNFVSQRECSKKEKECADKQKVSKAKTDKWLMTHHAMSVSAILISLMALGVKVTEIIKTMLRLG